MSLKKICIVGSGNWGSVIAKIVGGNAQQNDQFDSTVPMYVYEEEVGGEKLTSIINTRHENVKYLPGVRLPENVVAIPDVVEAAHDADFLVFVVPHQFIGGLCDALKGKLKEGAAAVSLCKGLDITEKGGVELISNVIRERLGVPCSVVMGANVAADVGKEQFCEATIGSRDRAQGLLLKEIMQTPYFRLTVVEDEVTVELCGALKNIVATGAGFIDGLGLGSNTKAAVIRLGMMEMIKFSKLYDANSQLPTFMESCGLADVVTTCYSGRNARVAAAYVTSGKSIAQLEEEMLNGQKLQGVPTAAEVHHLLSERGLTEEYPLFTAVHRICQGQQAPSTFIDCLRNHPEHH